MLVSLNLHLKKFSFILIGKALNGEVSFQTLGSGLVPEGARALALPSRNFMPVRECSIAEKENC